MILGALKCRRIVVGNFYLYPNTFFERKRKVVSKNGFPNIRMLTGEIVLRDVVSLFPKKHEENLRLPPHVYAEFAKRKRKKEKGKKKKKKKRKRRRRDRITFPPSLICPTHYY
jgi:hypothetical protein